MLLRGGFLKRVSGKVAYTQTGTLLRKEILRLVEAVLEEAGYHEVVWDQLSDLKEAKGAIHAYAAETAISYKDLPLQIYFTQSIRMREEAAETLWRAKHQTLLLFSSLGEVKWSPDDTLSAILDRLKLPYSKRGQGFYLESSEGKDRLSVVEPQKAIQKPGEKTLFDRKKMEKVKTPGIRTIEELREFFGCGKTDLLKTVLLANQEETIAVLVPGDREVDLSKVERLLDLPEGRLSPADEDRVKSVTEAEVGFAGPVGLKVDRILVDQGVNRDFGYIAGANETDHHLRQVYYGRDYSGDFGDVAMDEASKMGWMLGEVRTHREKIRVPDAGGSLCYEELITGYLNLDRILLALAETSLEEEGFAFPMEWAPFQVAIAIVDLRDERAMALGRELYTLLGNAGMRVLLDDRKDRMGSKFMDYDLMGIGMRIIIGKNPGEMLEVKNRKGIVFSVHPDNLVEFLQQ
jgi:prolyl-tRNA synthetase